MTKSSRPVPGSVTSGGAQTHFYYLDWVRAIASLLVLIHHGRQLFFRDAGESADELGLASKCFYFVTGFGSIAVTIFFVLSGCVIANVVIAARQRGGPWFWSYCRARLTRLWVVILPALLLTLVFDRLAWGWFPSALTHTATHYAHMLAPADRQHLGIGIFLGNLGFLQTILVPIYGSNGALWSLANEFWYYLIFPLAVMAWWPQQARSSKVGRWVCGGVAVLSLWFTGPAIAGSFPIWLLGVGVYCCWWRGFKISGCIGRWGVWLALGSVVLLLSEIRIREATHPRATDNFEAGLVTALLVLFLLYRRPTADGWLNAGLVRLSRMSFTLYAVHTPVLVAFASLAMNRAGNRWPCDGIHVSYLAGVLAVVLIYAYGIYLVTEARTADVRRWLATGWANFSKELRRQIGEPRDQQ